MINRYIISMQRVLCVVMPAFAYMLSDIDVPSVTLQHSVFVALVDYRISTPRAHISLCVPENGTKLEISILLIMLRIDKTILIVCILYNCVHNALNDFRPKHFSLSFLISLIDKYISFMYRFRCNRIIMFTSKDM